MITITLLGEPQSNNNIYRSHCRFSYPTVYLSADGKKLREDYMWQAKSQWKNKPINEDVWIEIVLYFKRGGKHDIDNFGKLLLDSLTGIVWNDDSQIQRMLITKFIDKIHPRIEITVGSM